MKLSILIPVYNERKTILDILERVENAKIPGVTKEIVVVDDGSIDGTREILKRVKGVKVILHPANMGKGAAIRTALDSATGDYIVIQDADLEYNPNQLGALLKPIVEDKYEVVYGTRLKRLPHFKKEERTPQFLIHYVGNRGLSLITSILYGQWITDMETCYKVIPREVFKDIKLTSNSFDFEAEITAKLLRLGYRIFEVPIKTTPRNYAEGKKLNTITDGVAALSTLLKNRFP